MVLTRSEIVCGTHIIWIFKVRTSIMVPQIFQYQPNLGPVSKAQPTKYVTRHLQSAKMVSRYKKL